MNSEMDKRDYEAALECFRYDPETGNLYWKVRPARNVFPGAIAGARTSGGYITTKLLGREVKAHRLAWLMTHGSWPENLVDHINGDRSDNRIVNLRQATHAQNMQNVSSRKGVHWRPNQRTWIASITVGGKRHYLGKFSDRAMAETAYREAKARLHPFWREAAA